jgi:hypothetical protein
LRTLSYQQLHCIMASTTQDEDADDDCAASRVAARSELWALFTEHGDGLVQAFRLMSVCKQARVEVKGWLRTLPGLVVCGGFIGGFEQTS